MNARVLVWTCWPGLALLAPGSPAAPILEVPAASGEDLARSATVGRLPDYLVIESVVVGPGGGPAGAGPYAAVPAALLRAGYLDLLPEAGSLLAPSDDLLTGVDADALRRRMGIEPAGEVLAPPARRASTALWFLALGLALALGVYLLQYRRRRRYARAARARRHIPIVGKRARSRRRRALAATRELPASGASKADSGKRHGGSRRSRSSRSASRGGSRRSSTSH